MNYSNALDIFNCECTKNDFKSIILILICLLVIFANSVNITVFVMPKMKDSSFKYMLDTSISNMFYLKLTLIGFFDQL